MTDTKEPWKQELHRGLEQMDGWVNPTLTDVYAWEKIILKERSNQREKLRRELTIFWLVAAVIFFLGLLSIMELPIVFVVVQVGALFGFPLYWAFKMREKVVSR